LKNCIVEIRAGTGGDEAGIFAGDLFKIYEKFAERKGFNIEVRVYKQSTLHDRYIMDDKSFWLSGNSLNYSGRTLNSTGLMI